MFELCLYIEQLIRGTMEIMYKKNYYSLIHEKLYDCGFQYFFKSAHFNEFKEHYKDLVAFIAKTYLTIRMNYEENKRSTVDKYVRHFHTKIVLFKYQ